MKLGKQAPYRITCPVDGYMTIGQLADKLDLTKRTTERLINLWQLNKVKYKNRWIVQKTDHPVFLSIQMQENHPDLRAVYSSSQLCKVLGVSRPHLHEHLSKMVPYTVLYPEGKWSKRLWFLSDLASKYHEITTTFKKHARRGRKHSGTPVFNHV